MHEAVRRLRVVPMHRRNGWRVINLAEGAQKEDIGEKNSAEDECKSKKMVSPMFMFNSRVCK